MLCRQLAFEVCTYFVLDAGCFDAGAAHLCAGRQSPLQAAADRTLHVGSFDGTQRKVREDCVVFCDCGKHTSLCVWCVGVICGQQSDVSRKHESRSLKVQLQHQVPLPTQCVHVPKF